MKISQKFPFYLRNAPAHGHGLMDTQAIHNICQEYRKDEPCTEWNYIAIR